ncbi:hydrogenase (NiFe) small subunit HydA [Thermocrinis albus DSM 14484]|uniref:Hydrogenase (NiFe) small subunit HydA n=1 Tax=Thermocrinis albus (strain DSM 14484 / JCM 11386 / HI 11/12) TaxID=638303 RepID=D3SMR8_THEAH|nr:hydrogenase small subunit [Thermocrinis albus]ADC90048.1 hydrogenase (NiFe) small subunit HydA [Thermocrinis albus DSM 14484]
METVWDLFRRRGYSRREFLSFVSVTASLLALPANLLMSFGRALELREKPVVIWLEFQDCAGCSESFIRSTSVMPSDVLLDFISLEYHETLMVPSGIYAEQAKEDAIKKYRGRYILIVEGALTPAEDGVYCTVGGKANHHLLREAIDGAKWIVAVGSCACWGGIPAAYPNPTGAVPISDLVEGKTVVHLPGCPPIGDVLVATLVHLIAFERLPELDSMGRPKVFYGQTIHDRCYRRSFYSAGKFASGLDDDGARKGYCLYKVGCKGPITRNACATIRWNGGLSFPIQSGHPCFGCSEPNFWDRGFIYKPLSAMPDGFGPKGMLGALAVGTLVGAGVAYMNKKQAKKGGK